MTKITLTDLANLQNETAAVNAINANNALIETAFDNTLSRDGTVPNTMGNNLDMNSNQILNLPAPATAASPARLQDVVSGATLITVPPVGTSGAVVGLLNTNNTHSGNNTFSGTNAFNGVATLASPVITGHATIEGTTLTGKTGTGNLVLSNSPVITGGGSWTSGTLVSCGITSCAMTSSTIATSPINVNCFNSGTGASSSTFLRGDATWTVPILSSITASLGADVALNNTGTYFDGPSVAQGSTGTWHVSGTISLQDTGAAAIFHVKLWDGTTVIASGITQSFAANATITVSLSGILATPAGNLRLSVKDVTATTGKILFNATANSKDSTITAIRIA